MNLSGKKVLLTGGAIRVGSYFARQLAAAGATLYLHCRNSYAAAEQLIAQLPGKDHRIFVCNFLEENAPQQLFAQLPPVDLLVCNASVFRLNLPTQEARRQYQRINCQVPLQLLELYASQEHLTSGAAVLITDAAAENPPPVIDDYLQSKINLRSGILAGARHYAPRIRVNGLAPGPVLPPPGLEHLKMQQTLKHAPLGRTATLQDLAAALQFLLENDSITGEILRVDAGICL